MTSKWAFRNYRRIATSKRKEYESIVLEQLPLATNVADTCLEATEDDVIGMRYILTFDINPYTRLEWKYGLGHIKATIFHMENYGGVHWKFTLAEEYIWVREE